MVIAGISALLATSGVDSGLLATSGLHSGLLAARSWRGKTISKRQTKP